MSTVQFRFGWSLVTGHSSILKSITGDHPEWGKSYQSYEHVLRIRVDRRPLWDAVRSIARPLPQTLRSWVRYWFPAPFLPPTVVVKKLRPDRADEFENEIHMYCKLKPLQGFQVPVLYGEIRVEGCRALLLSDAGGDQIRALPGLPAGSPEEEELKQKLREALRPLYRLGISPVDADVVNCHITGDGRRIVLVDHGQDEVIEPLSGSELDERVEEKTEGIISQHRQLRGPKPPSLSPRAAREAQEIYGTNHATLANIARLRHPPPPPPPRCPPPRSAFQASSDSED